MARLGSALAHALCLGLAAGRAAGAAEVPVEQIAVERVILPLRVEPADCPAPVLAAIEVLEDGVPCASVSVDRNGPPRLHALLIDTSATMEPLVETLGRAAATYLERLAPQELSLVATFADDLILRAGLSGDRAQQLAVLRQLPVGYRTALLDALHSMLLYLEPRGERKVIVLFTDGVDNASLVGHAGTALAQAARDAGDVRVFTILLRNRAQPDPGSVSWLRDLGAATGGALFEVRGAAGVEKAYRDIAARLAGEAALAYAPPPATAGEPRWHDVVVRLPDAAACRVELPVPRRLGGRARSRGATEPVIETLSPKAPLPSVLTEFCEVGRTCWQPVEVLQFPGPQLWPVEPGEPSRLTLLSPPYHVAGRALDVTRQRGALYDEGTLGEHGRYRLLEDAPAVIEPREFVLTVPALDEVREQFHSAADVLERWMLRGGGGPAAFVQGQTWLELRPWLAQALVRSRTDYAGWADGKLAGVPAARDASAWLAEWLPDIPAREAALALELRVANELRLLGGDERNEQRERLEGFWPHMAEWLATPTRVRLRVPLFPLYDAKRDAIGFQRIVLPRPRAAGAPPTDPVPPHPFGVRMLERLLNDRNFPREFSPVPEIAAIDYRPVLLGGSRATPDGGHEEPTAPGLPPYGAFESVLRFATPQGEVALSSVLVQDAEQNFQLECMAVAGPRDDRLADWLAAYVAGAGQACKRGLTLLPVDD